MTRKPFTTKQTALKQYKINEGMPRTSFDPFSEIPTQTNQNPISSYGSKDAFSLQDAPLNKPTENDIYSQLQSFTPAITNKGNSQTSPFKDSSLVDQQESNILSGYTQPTVVGSNTPQQPNKNILGEQPTQKTYGGVSVAKDINGNPVISNTTNPYEGMFTGMSKERDAALVNGKVDKNSDFYKRNLRGNNRDMDYEANKSVSQAGIQYNTTPTSASVDFNNMQSKPQMYQGEQVQSPQYKSPIGQNQFSNDKLSWQDKLRFDASNQDPLLRRY